MKKKMQAKGLGGLFLLLVVSGLLSGCTNEYLIPCSEQEAGANCDPLAHRGPYKVFTTRDVYIDTSILAQDERWDSVKDMRGIAYLPSDNGDAPLSSGDVNFPSAGFPLLIMLHGFGVNGFWYDHHSRHLASHGVMVLALNYSDAKGVDGRHDLLAEKISLAIDWALAEPSPSEVESPSPFYGLTDGLNRVAIMGHSQGGKTAFYTAAIDSRVRAVIAMDPSNSGGAPCFISPNHCHNYPVAPSFVKNGEGELELHSLGLLKEIKQPLASLIVRSEPSATNPEVVHNARYFFDGIDSFGRCGVKGPALYLDRGASGHASYLLSYSSSTKISLQMAVAWLQHSFLGMDRSDYLHGEILQQYLNDDTLKKVSFRSEQDVLPCD